MQERVRFGVAIQLTLDVVLDVEVGRRVAIFAIAVAEEVVKRIDACRGNVRIFL